MLKYNACYSNLEWIECLWYSTNESTQQSYTLIFIFLWWNHIYLWCDRTQQRRLAHRNPIFKMWVVSMWSCVRSEDEVAVKFVQVFSLPRAPLPVFRFLYAPTSFEIIVVALWLADDRTHHYFANAPIYVLYRFDLGADKTWNQIQMTNLFLLSCCLHSLVCSLFSFPTQYMPYRTTQAVSWHR